ncbi:MAG: hypothetical protein INH41_07320 [Myxococcaceae bacterium]|jgi:hypothetical protein|nr:hypothetical protein [Myxococcaceae bacterium]MCA3012196.1 hypothetical protein [Myxococcaceae bacterium]
MTPMLQPLAVELANGWSVREILGLVFVGVLITVIWIKFRQMEFPPEWEHGPPPAPKPPEPPTPPEASRPPERPAP